MILSPYRNPPYRIQKPSAPSSSSTPPSSPKRPRSELDQPGTPPSQRSRVVESEDDNVSGSRSPRLQVAEKLKSLDLRHTSLAGSPKKSAPRKRIKKIPLQMEYGSENVGSAIITSTEGSLGREIRGAFREPSLEIMETPQARDVQQSSTFHSAPSSQESVEAIEALQWTDEMQFETSEAPSLSTATSIGVELLERSVSPLPLREQLTPDQATLTWQEDEITGHEVDAESGDDGEGINGIGFKPTPAIAYARRQKRKQQVNEWKAREAREARKRRFEKRRLAGMDLSSDGLEAGDGRLRRMVRFAPIGEGML